jgi:hypothetical protein
VHFVAQKTQKHEKSAISAHTHHEKPHTHTHTKSELKYQKETPIQKETI